MNRADRSPPSRYHRTLFLSDLHIGATGSRPDLVLAFLEQNHADTYLLVGDILDLWHPLLPHWSPAAEAVLAHLRQRAAEGARLTYVRGNHDPEPETAPLLRRLPVIAQEKAVHSGADGRRWLVIHGDCADGRVLRSHILTRIGSRLDNGLRRLDRGLARWRLPQRDSFDPARRSLIEWAIKTINLGFYLGRGHERRLIDLARAEGLDGVICGHFHIAALHEDHGLTYANCGDWMDSFTALAEDAGGGLHLLGGRAALAAARRPGPLNASRHPEQGAAPA